MEVYDNSHHDADAVFHGADDNDVGLILPMMKLVIITDSTDDSGSDYDNDGREQMFQR